MNPEIRDAEPRDYPAIADLMRDFIGWHYTRHASDRAIIDSYFGPEAYEAELRSLPGSYARPEGAFLRSKRRPFIESSASAM